MEIINKAMTQSKHGFSVGETYYIDGVLFVVVQDDASEDTLYRLMSLDDCCLTEYVYDSLSEMKIVNPDFVPVKCKIVVE
jgi:hypothetical protein